MFLVESRCVIEDVETSSVIMVADSVEMARSIAVSSMESILNKISQPLDYDWEEYEEDHITYHNDEGCIDNVSVYITPIKINEYID